MIRTSDRSVIEVARSLGISDSTLHNWLKADREARERASNPGALSDSGLKELERLRKENI